MQQRGVRAVFVHVEARGGAGGAGGPAGLQDKTGAGCVGPAAASQFSTGPLQGELCVSEHHHVAACPQDGLQW
jgi:hypothetical protein